ncbi:hypothetical protein [Paracoccus aminophilus]|uniref:Uncharacterized protein n=1 Tax=Paracoccus aminophilus JCM 7686 TaxID=1367847 RepID=S5Y0V8_PARAH|nr:hypothetical protein [Paracoccus aminophilus]AGT11132.1 hypothetical protein JCM7686_pAMI5p066 [Paracoccus aminophilus JCM 7686]
MKYSVQQIKYELLGYMKAIDADFRHWTIGTSDDPAGEMQIIPGADLDRDPWIFKPAVSAIAARNIQSYFTGILACRLPPGDEQPEAGSCVFAIRLVIPYQPPSPPPGS